MIEFRVHDMDELAHRVAQEGLDAHPVAVIELAQAAHDRGLAQVLIDVLVDPAEPLPARLRAFGRIVTALSAMAPSAEPTPSVAVAAGEIPAAVPAGCS